MIYFLFGSDWRSSQKALSDIIRRFEQGGQNRIPVVIDAEETPENDVRALLNARSLFHNEQLFVIKRLFASPHLYEFFSSEFSLLKKRGDHIVFWERDHPLEAEGEGSLREARRALFRKVIRHGETTEFSLKRAPVRDDNARGVMFQLADAWSLKNTTQALVLYHRLLRLGVVPEQIFWTLHWHIQTLLSVEAFVARGLAPGEIQRTAKLHPFVIKKSITQLSHLGKNTLKSALARLLTIDHKTKSTPIELESALLHFLLTS